MSKAYKIKVDFGDEDINRNCSESNHTLNWTRSALLKENHCNNENISWANLAWKLIFFRLLSALRFVYSL